VNGKIIALSREFTQVTLPKDEREAAVQAAFWVTASPHEWTWTPEQQAAMARYCLWAAQRIEAIREIAVGSELLHEK
jgi:hypothetical protein